MRPSPAQAMARVNQYISFLEEHRVPTALFKQRVKDISDWGQSVQLRKPNPAAPKSAEMKGIQSALDEMCKSEKYVRDQRRGEYPHYPYASEEQKTLAEPRPHIHTYTHTLLHARTHTHTHTRTTHASWTDPPTRPLARCACRIAHDRTHTHTCTHARTHAHMHTCTHAHGNMHTHTWARNHACS